MLLAQPDFFVQLTIHGDLRRLARIDAALRKLPRVLAHPFAPKNFILRVAKNDAYIGAVPIAVYHDHDPINALVALILPQFWGE